MNSRFYKHIKDYSKENNSTSIEEDLYDELDKPSPNTDDYYRMDCRSAARTRSWTVESGISEISFLSEDTQGKSWNGETDSEGIPCHSRFKQVKRLPEFAQSRPECSSLPTKLSYQCPAEPCQLSRQHIAQVSLDRRQRKLTNNPNYLSQESINRRMIRTSQSISCLPLAPEPVSPVLMFLPKILRSSFSKIMSIPRRSKSPVTNKNSLENESWSSPSDDLNRRASASSLVSPITEEIVSDSLEKGLPIIPFAYPTFHVTSLEDNKQSARKNSLKNLKLAFCENKRKNRNIYKEEEEILQGLLKSKALGDLVIESEEVGKEESNKSEVNASNSKEVCHRKKMSDDSTVSHSSYVEMSPGAAYTRLESRTTKINFGEEPYMHMNEFMQGHNKHKCSDEQIFHLEQGSPRPREAPVLRNKRTESECTSPTKKSGTLFSMGEGTMSMERGLSRLRRKGNKHKADYVFVDFEKNNYVDMQQLGGKKWKFLTFPSTSKSREK
eukprot:GFUD01003866.1.p1 GENE.GFUD01003866.1~~GFUD01003866.1.p1  ORF type:complete len:497 (+),score=78.30 GFUD01003866.1:618-2108(+)